MKQLILPILLLTSSILFSQSTSETHTMKNNQTFEFIIHTEDSDTHERIEGVQVYLYESESGSLVSTNTTVDGYTSFQIDPNKEYEVRTCHNGYFKNGMNLAMCQEEDEILCLYGANNMAFVAGGGEHKPNALLMAKLSLSPMNIGSVYELENVYYDLDKSFLRKTAKKELDELADIMKLNQSITIELSSHTDSRGSDAYNLALSDRRAQSCYKYLLSQGIAAERIIPKGYGETKHVNECSNGVNCDESKHQKNRRTEIEILTYEPIACAPYDNVKFARKSSCLSR